LVRGKPGMFEIASPSDLIEPLRASGSLEAGPSNARDTDLQRAEGAGRIVLGGSETGTRIIEVFQRSPVRVMFPTIGCGAVEEAVLVNTAGGIAGGDRLETDVTALPNAAIVVTSQAAEKVYRALSEPARITTKVKVHAAAKVAWLPQETIVFNRGRLNRRAEIELSSGAELLALEWLVLGRLAHGEEIVGGHITDSWRVRQDGRLIWADSFRVADATFPHLHRKPLLSNCKAVATLVYFGPGLETRLEFLRDIAPSLASHCAATAVGGLIIVRLAAEAPFELRGALRSLLERFGRELGGAPFRVPKMWSC
jgi:urease accessory protein